MKLKNRLMPALLFCGMAALSSCENNEQDSVNPELEQGMLSHILTDSAEVTAYTFAGKQLSQVNHYNQESGELESFEKYAYNSSGKLVKTTTHAASNQALLAEQHYTYDSDGLLTKTETDYYSGGKLEYSAYATFEYDEEKHLESTSLFEVNKEKKEAVAVQKSYTTYEVLPNGNYAEMEQYVVDEKDQASLFSTTTYSYDQNQNPFHEFAEPGTASSPNNLIASSVLVHNSNKTHQYTYAYTYNAHGYPLTQTVLAPTGKQEAFSFQYSN